MLKMPIDVDLRSELCKKRGCKCTLYTRTSVYRPDVLLVHELVNLDGTGEEIQHLVPEIVEYAFRADSHWLSMAMAREITRLLIVDHNARWYQERP